MRAPVCGENFGEKKGTRELEMTSRKWSRESEGVGRMQMCYSVLTSV
jgi:hypothetical protein